MERVKAVTKSRFRQNLHLINCGTQFLDQSENVVK